MGKPEKASKSTLTNFIDAHSGDLLMLRADDIRAALTPALCLEALEEAYRHLHAAPDDIGHTVGFETDNGKIHIKAGLSPGTHKYFAAKVNANFPGNMAKYGAPTIRGLIVLCDCADGRPVAILQSGELTGLRTAAATALAAKYGARGNATKLAMIGCGSQARHQVSALTGVRSISHLTAVDTDTSRAQTLADWASETLGIEATASADISSAISNSDIAVTCTPAKKVIVTADMVPPGCFLAAVGADSPGKQELAPDVFTNARILVDDLELCAEGGDLAHAISAGTARREDVAATLAGLAATAVPGRASDDEIVIFDSTGTGLQDVAAAAAVYDAIRRKEEA